MTGETALAASVLVFALVGCKPAAGGRCSDRHEMLCQGDGSALVCASGRYVSMDCDGVCDKARERTCPHPDVGQIGKGCYQRETRGMPEEQFVTTPDGRSCLRCRTEQQGGGVWEAARTCEPGSKCIQMGGCTTAR